MKRRINEDFMPTGAQPSAALAQTSLGSIPKQSSSRFFQKRNSGIVANNSNGSGKFNATVVPKQPQRAAPIASKYAQTSRQLKPQAKSITISQLQLANIQEEEKQQEDEHGNKMDELAEALEKRAILDDAAPISLPAAADGPIQNSLQEQIRALTLEIIPELERKLMQSEKSRLEDVRKLVFAVKSERAAHAKQLRELAQSHQQVPPASSTSEKEIALAKEEALRDFIAKQAAQQEIEVLEQKLAAANAALAESAEQIAQLQCELAASREDCALQRAYMMAS